MIALIAQMDAKLDACVAYFTEGGPFEWIAGGAFVILGIVFFFTKKNIVSMIKGAIGKVLSKK